MERKSLVPQAGGESLLPLMETDEAAAFINGMYAGMSYSSLLSLSIDNNPNYEPPLVNDHMVCATAAASEIQQSSETEHFNADQKLKFPKLEVPVVNDTPPPFQLYPYNNEYFLNEPFNYEGFGYQNLPDLRCLKQTNYFDFHYGDSSSSLVSNRVEPSNFPKRKQPPSSSTARLQRQKLSEKTRCLEKLLPWDKKMDTATMLEEAYKYVKFLQAQVSVLQNMPLLSEGGASSSSSEDKNGKSTSVFGKLGRLNRQQLLEVVLNSPVAQTYLYSKGCCVYSVEQLVQYRKIAQRNALYRQMLFYAGMPS
ncbi:transcription factor [Capsicum galapagoense]